MLTVAIEHVKALRKMCQGYGVQVPSAVMRKGLKKYFYSTVIQHNSNYLTSTNSISTMTKNNVLTMFFEVI